MYVNLRRDSLNDFIKIEMMVEDYEKVRKALRYCIDIILREGVKEDEDDVNVLDEFAYKLEGIEST